MQLRKWQFAEETSYEGDMAVSVRPGIIRRFYLRLPPFFLLGALYAGLTTLFAAAAAWRA